MIINNYLIPVFVLLIILYGIIKKIDVYGTFIEGCKEGIKLSLMIVPTYFAMIFAINIFIKSGIINFISQLIALPKPISQVLPMIFIRPISGTASLGILNDIFIKYGPDSLSGLIASTIEGCTDTTFYVLTLYYGSVKINKTRYSLFVGLMADLVGILSAIIIVYLLFD